METLTYTICLRGSCFCLRVINIIDCQIQLIVMLFYLIAFRKAPLSSLSDQTCQFWQSRNTRFIQVNRSKSGLNRNQPLTASDHPIRNYLWLVRTLLAQHKKLQAGEVILTGSIIRPMDLKAGQYQFQMLGQQVSLKVT